MNIQAFSNSKIISSHFRAPMDNSLQQQDELIQRALTCLESRIKNLSNALTSPDDVRNFLRLKLAQEKNEHFATLFLDNQHRVIAFESLFHGTITESMVYPRVVLQRALFHNAAAVIFAHNHPSGYFEPSTCDKLITKQLTEMLAIIDVRVLDHFIVAAAGIFSFAEGGLL